MALFAGVVESAPRQLVIWTSVPKNFCNLGTVTSGGVKIVHIVDSTQLGYDSSLYTVSVDLS